MLIDCDTCVARGRECADCVVSVFLHISSARPVTAPAPAPMALDDDERAAVETLAAAGLVPPLRLVAALPTGLPDSYEGIA